MTWTQLFLSLIKNNDKMQGLIKIYQNMSIYFVTDNVSINIKAQLVVYKIKSWYLMSLARVGKSWSRDWNCHRYPQDCKKSRYYGNFLKWGWFPHYMSELSIALKMGKIVKIPTDRGAVTHYKSEHILSFWCEYFAGFCMSIRMRADNISFVLIRSKRAHPRN